MVTPQSVIRTNLVAVDVALFVTSVNLNACLASILYQYGVVSGLVALYVMFDVSLTQVAQKDNHRLDPSKTFTGLVDVVIFLYPIPK